MTGKCKNKDIDNGPKKKEKKEGMVSRQQTGIHIRSDNTASLPPKDTLPHCYSRPTVPHILILLRPICIHHWNILRRPLRYL